MDTSIDTGLNPSELIRTLRTHVRWWVVPAVAGGLLAAVYSLVAPREWRATQALIVRPEVASVSDERLGKFSDLSEMKTLQETILELAKSRSVVAATLKEVGPKSGRVGTDWPTAQDIEDFREQIDMRPPGGAEFGKTEVFYLTVKDTDRDRASELAAAACGQLEKRMRQLRDQRAKSMIAEQERTVAMAEHDLEVSTHQLAAFEGSIGADLAELRNLNAEVGGQSEAAQELQAIKAEQRANDDKQRENERLRALLVAAQEDTNELLATPNSLLQSQPSVSRLKDALVDTQVRVARLLGGRSEKHPFVVAAAEAEKLVRQQLHDEISVAVKGVELELALNADREAALAERLASAQERLSRLAGERAEYANLLAVVDHHTTLLDAARKNLTDARARQAGARSASVISRIDGVEAGVRPAGPGRATITAAGGMGGLLLGLGLVFPFAPPVSEKLPACGLPTVGKQNGKHCEVQSETKGRRCGLFRGLSLDKAIERVEQRIAGKLGW